jgi:dCMP deaminase
LKIKRYNFKDLTGQRFSCLKVLRQSDKCTKTRGVLWECQCDCGNIVELPSNGLTSGNNKTCGNLKKHPRPIELCGEIPIAYINAAKQNATKRNFSFEVTGKYIWDLFLKQNRKCALSGENISFKDGIRSCGGFSASLDRIDNNKGYIEGNVRWLHKDINRMRWVCNDNEFLNWCKKCLDYSMAKDSRPTWDEYALMIAKVAAERSQDPYKKTGACILRYDKSIAGIGYNGAPRGIEIDWSDRDERRKRVIHAEINALAYCKPGEGWLLACNLLPCHNCLQAIAANGIKRIVYEEVYDKDSLTLILAKEFGIELIQLNSRNIYL